MADPNAPSGVKVNDVELTNFEAWQQGIGYEGDDFSSVMWQHDRAAAVQWARDILANPNAVILDTETTGIGPKAEPIQIAVLDLNGRALLDCLVRTEVGIADAAYAKHGMLHKDLALAATFEEVYPLLCRVLEGRTVVVYNVAFDADILGQTCTHHGLEHLPVKEWTCCMLQYAAFVGDWNDYRGSWRWQKLPEGDHSASGDCRSTLRLIRKMAEADSGQS